MGIIDIHGHYAFGIDDGAQTEEETIALLKYAKENNVSHICMTPHIKPGKMHHDFMNSYRDSFEATIALAKEYHIQALTGSELLLNDLTYDYLNEKKFFSLNNTKYLLVEFDITKSFEENKSKYDDLLYEIEVQGYTPVIAHVERYFKSVDLDQVRQWIRYGYVIQVNIQSFVSKSVHEKRNAYKLLEEGYIHVLASDSHSVKNFRKPSFKQTISAISKYTDQKELKILLKDNPLHILKNEKIESLVRR